MSTEKHEESFTNLVRSAYQAQKARITMGGRLVSMFRKKLGLDDEEKITDEEEKNVLRQIQRRYKLVTEGIARRQISSTEEEEFSYDSVISNYAEVSLCTSFFRLSDNEADLFESVGRRLEKFPIWHEFLSGVKGVGPKMAGVVISEFNPERGKYVSSFWKYAGLDTVSTWHRMEDGEYEEVETPPSSASFNDERSEARKDGTVWKKKRIARSRRPQHLEEEEYEASDGTTKTRKTITFNKFLHDKLLGVAGECMMRAGGHYKNEVYDPYKNRLKHMDRHESKSDGHLNRMAIRYMVKIFVQDLYKAWRPLVGMPVHDPYREAKLGKEPHGKGQ